MIKIGFVNFDMSIRGGAQQVLHNIVNALCAEEEKKYEIHVISLIQEKEACAYPLHESIHYQSILSYKGRIRDVIFHAGKALRRYCREQKLELLFFVGVYAGFCGGLLGKKLRIPKVFCDHGALMNQWNEAPIRFMRIIGSRYSDKIVVLTQQSEKAYYDKFSCRQGKVITIYNWIDDLVLQHAQPYDIQSRCLLTAGRFAAEKGMDLLVDTAVRLKEKTSDFVWDVYGDGELFAEIRERIESEGLTEQVHLKGLTNQMERCYGGHAMYVLTSYREGLPLVLLEAKANHLPLISFDIVSGPAEIITDGKDGVLVPPYDTARMAECIYELLENQEKRICLSEKSDLKVEKFRKEKILSQWMALIEEMITDEDDLHD